MPSRLILYEPPKVVFKAEGHLVLEQNKIHYELGGTFIRMALMYVEILW